MPGNTGAVEVHPDGSHPTRAFALDDLLVRYGRVDLLKLDCEGSEWPILAHASQLHRVRTICGEYHERELHPLCPEFDTPFTRGLLRRLLAAHFPYVRVARDPADKKLGKFWASREPLAF